MKATDLHIRKWGNSLGVRLPVAVARAAGLAVDQRVRLVVEDGRVTICPLDGAEPTLEDRLAQFDPNRHGGEAMADSPVGAERW